MPTEIERYRNEYLDHFGGKEVNGKQFLRWSVNRKMTVSVSSEINTTGTIVVLVKYSSAKFFEI